MRFLSLVLANFRRHRLRTTLTIGSIVAAFVLFALLAAIGKAFEMGVSVAGANRIITRHKISIIQPLPQSYDTQIRAIDGVATTAQASWFGGVYQNHENAFPQIAVDAQTFFDIYPEFVIDPKQKAAWAETRTAAIAGRKLMERYGWKLGQRIPIQATFLMPKQGNTWTFDLVGVYDGNSKEVDTTQFFFRHDYLDENRRYGKGMTGWIYIKVKDPKNAETLARKIDEKFANSPAETKTETEKAFVRGFAEQMGNIGAILTAILSAVFFTILLVAGNTMAQTVRERTGELGVLKAIGFSDAQVLLLVLAESVTIAVIGGAIGLGLGWLLVSRGDPTGGALPVFFFPPAKVVEGAILVLVLGVVTGALPAIQAMRLNAVEALRRE